MNKKYSVLITGKVLGTIASMTLVNTNDIKLAIAIYTRIRDPLYISKNSEDRTVSKITLIEQVGDTKPYTINTLKEEHFDINNKG